MSLFISPPGNGAGPPDVRGPAWTAHGEGDQIFRLEQGLLQDAWNQHGMQDIDHRDIRDGSVRRRHRSDRKGDKAVRLELFLPVGLYLQAGVKITIDDGTSYRLPYVWCLTNTWHCGRPGRAEAAQGIGDRHHPTAPGCRLRRADGEHVASDQPVRGGSTRASNEGVRTRLP